MVTDTDAETSRKSTENPMCRFWFALCVLYLEDRAILSELWDIPLGDE
jgi:hypothetical protein